MKNLKLVGLTAVAVVALGVAGRAEDNASITGKAIFAGEAPKLKKVKMDADPACVAAHADKPAMIETVIVNANGTLKNVFVYVKSGVTGTYECPKTPVSIVQEGCTYHPHVFGMHTGQLLLVKNADDLAHNIHAKPTATGNSEFNNGQPAQGADLKKTFLKPEIMVPVNCDLHPWMNAYVGVLDHPFYAVTGDDGSFSIKGLPAGDYEVEAWHEKYGTQKAKLKVGAGEAKTADFTFKAE